MNNASHANKDANCPDHVEIARELATHGQDIENLKGWQQKQNGTLQRIQERIEETNEHVAEANELRSKYDAEILRAFHEYKDEISKGLNQMELRMTETMNKKFTKLYLLVVGAALTIAGSAVWWAAQNFVTKGGGN